MVITILLSFRNEAGNIDELIRRCRAALDRAGVEHEFVFVDDVSNDGSREILERYAAEDPRIKVLTMSRRFGHPACMMAGFAHATGDAVIYLDADLQDPPELIPDLVAEFKNGADVVNTTRTERLGENRFKMVLTKFGYWLINVFSDTDIPMETSNFKLTSRRVVEQLLRLREYDPFLRGLVRWVGFKQVQIFYRREPRHAGATHFPLHELAPAKDLIAGITSFSSAPLYFSLLCGFVVSAGSFGYIVYIVITRLAFGMHNPGWPAEMVTILLLGGVILFTNGILGIYVAGIHRDVKRRPSYIVASAVNVPVVYQCERAPAADAAGPSRSGTAD